MKCVGADVGPGRAVSANQEVTMLKELTVMEMATERVSSIQRYNNWIQVMTAANMTDADRGWVQGLE